MLNALLIISTVSPYQDQMDDEHDVPKDKKRRKNHTVLERQRRSEQRNLFDKLQTVLQSDPRAPRLRLLSLVSSKSYSGSFIFFYATDFWKTFSYYEIHDEKKKTFYLSCISLQVPKFKYLQCCKWLWIQNQDTKKP